MADGEEEKDGEVNGGEGEGGQAEEGQENGMEGGEEKGVRPRMNTDSENTKTNSGQCPALAVLQ